MNSVELTRRNLLISKEFMDGASKFAGGVLLSGSNAWGANYAVNENSDIDLIIVTEKIDDIGKIMDVYLARGLVDEVQIKRFETFRKLNEKDKADTFSFRVFYKNTWVGLDFFTSDIVDKIINLEPIGVVIDGLTTFRTMREFRSNPPIKSGYLANSLISQKSLTYHPAFEEVEGGYISNTLVDGQCGEYLMGVYSFFFAIEPKVLFGGQNITNRILTIQSNIKKQLNGQSPFYITRQERMNAESLSRIKESFC